MSHSLRSTVIGTGNVGAPLGRRLTSLGYHVAFGARDVAAAAEKLPYAWVMSQKEATADADVVILTVPASVALGTAKGLDLRPGTIPVDTTNPVKWEGGPVWDPPAEGSMAAALAAALPGVRVVMGFSHFTGRT